MGKIHIKFDKKDRAKFEIETDNDSQLFTAILGLEGYIAGKADLPVSEIRSIIDEMKQGKTIRIDK